MSDELNEPDEPDDERPRARRFWFKAIVVIALSLFAIYALLNLAAMYIGS
jgi:hypothetical protein